MSARITGTVTGAPNPIVPEFQYPLMAMLSLTLVTMVAGKLMLRTKRCKNAHDTPQNFLFFKNPLASNIRLSCHLLQPSNWSLSLIPEEYLYEDNKFLSEQKLNSLFYDLENSVQTCSSSRKGPGAGDWRRKESEKAFQLLRAFTSPSGGIWAC
jgi:hypothetical protein